MRVRIVSYEDINSWILGKFARKLKEELLKLDVAVDIAGEPDPTAEINHHIIYIAYNHRHPADNDTLMITHIDDLSKFKLLSKQMEHAKLGICMSRDTMMQLIDGGIPAQKLAYVNPAHDNNIRPKPWKIGVTTRIYPDGCKREGLLEQLCEHISPEFFEFEIMGTGWDAIIKKMKNRGFKVVYYSEFDDQRYIDLMRSLDYYLYLGMDEGSMGYLDALAAGVKTIVTAQGFHLDAATGITHSFKELKELIQIFKKIEDERISLIESVSNWKWKDYAIKHYQLWSHLLSDGNAGIDNMNKYQDGLNSLLHKTEKNSGHHAGISKSKLLVATVKKKILKVKKIDSLKEFSQKIQRKFGKK